MTDKDIKDYCKNCDVEPPAMRFKCPECEHNPDKEQIMIDGVDVSECVHYEDLSCTAFRDSCGYPLDCKNFFFCNYKQLARKTQVIDEIEEVIKPYQEQIELDALSLPSAIESILERKTQECEELKGKYKNVLDLAKQNADANEYCLQELEQENYRYRKALEEIEKYCSNAQDPCQDNWTREKENFAKIILDIISRAKGK